jgi:Ca-activated chloride channel family protein
MKRTVSLVTLGILSAAAVVDAQTFRSAVDLVSFGVTAVDRKGEFVTDLKEEDFEIYEDGKKQAIRHFIRSDADPVARPPLHLGLLFDTSGSMGEDLQMSRTAAIKFLNTLTEAADMTLVDFDTEVRTARYGQAEFPRLVERIRSRKADGWTALYDALGVYLDGASDQEGRKILVLYTDGGDTRSSLSFSDTLTLLKASDVTVYAVGFLQHQSAQFKTELQQKLRQVVQVTGGQAFFPLEVEDLDEAYEDIREEIAAQYSIGFLSSNLKTDGTWREVEIKLVRPDIKGVRLRTRKGYFAAYRESDRP